MPIFLESERLSGEVFLSGNHIGQFIQNDLVFLRQRRNLLIDWQMIQMCFCLLMGSKQVKLGRMPELKALCAEILHSITYVQRSFDALRLFRMKKDSDNCYSLFDDCMLSCS